MKRFQADFFVDLSRFFGKIDGLMEYLTKTQDFDVTQPMPEEIKKSRRESLDDVDKACVDLGLTTSIISINRMRDLLSRPHATYAQFHGLIVELLGRLKDEMSGVIFLSLTPQETDHYQNPLQGWDKVVNQFPSAIVDIEESSKCLACGRHTASVFHLMRITEVGLRALGVALKDPNLDPKTNPTWERILAKCDSELRKPRNERSPEWAVDDVFFSEAVANVRAVKDAWRNPTLHVEISYDEEKSHDVRNAVRGFMRHLAMKLHE